MQDGKLIISKTYLDRMLIPNKYVPAKLSQIPLTCIHREHVCKYIFELPVKLEKGEGLLLWGAYGTGKSAASVIILKYVALLKKTGLFITADEIADCIINKKDFDDTMTMEDRMREVDLLVIDELKIKGDSKFSETIVETLVRRRIADCKAVIITMNHTPKELGEKYPALAHVLTEAVFPIKFAGHDFRSDIKDAMGKSFLEG